LLFLKRICFFKEKENVFFKDKISPLRFIEGYSYQNEARNSSTQIEWKERREVLGAINTCFLIRILKH